MNEENTKYLFDNFKFFHPEKSSMESLMCYGFDCGDGWFELIKDLCEKLQALNMPDFEVIGVNEKLATLSFCIDHDSVPEEHKEKVLSLIREAGHKSAETCEDCGKPGAIRRLKWLMVTKCVDCFVNYEE